MSRHVEIDVERMKKKAQAQEYLSEVFGFPDYYGRNLDAFADALGEMAAASPLQITVKGAGRNLPDELGYASGVIKVLKDLQRQEPDRIQIFIRESD